MTQPPDDLRPVPGEPPELPEPPQPPEPPEPPELPELPEPPQPPETPMSEPPETPMSEPPEVPASEPPETPMSEQPTVAWTPPPPATLPTDPAPAASPILSATTTPLDATESAPPTASGPAPVVGWEMPAAPAPAPNREGYVIAGVGARIVAWLIDGLIVTVVPGTLGLLVYDYGTIFREAMGAARTGQTGYTATLPITTDLVLITLISIAISFIYFVGLWTSGSRATLGMRGLRMQVVDARTGGALSLGQAIKRWAVLGAPLGLLGLVPVLQSLGGLIQLALVVVLFFTTIVNERRQGLHDRVADSLVTRSVTSGDGATVIGCLVFGALVIGISIVGIALFFAAFGPELQQLMIDIGNSI